MNKDLIKKIIILLIIVVGGVAIYIYVIKPKQEKKNNKNNEQPEEDKVIFTSCFDIEDKETCNTVTDDQSGNRRCEYKDILQQCRNISIPPTCQDANIVRSGFLSGEPGYSELYQWEPDISGNLTGNGVNKINPSIINNNIPGIGNLVLLDIGKNTSDTCEWEEYNVPEFKVSTDSSCNFVLSIPQSQIDGNKYPDENITCQGVNNNLFLVSNTINGCNDVITDKPDCTSINDQENCNNDFCVWNDGQCLNRSNLSSISGYICGTKTIRMKNCYNHNSLDSCPSNCKWIANKNKCLPLEYPLSNNNHNITDYYSFEGIDCNHEDLLNTTTCYTRG